MIECQMVTEEAESEQVRWKEACSPSYHRAASGIQGNSRRSALYVIQTSAGSRTGAPHARVYLGMIEIGSSDLVAFLAFWEGRQGKSQNLLSLFVRICSDNCIQLLTSSCFESAPYIHKLPDPRPSSAYKTDTPGTFPTIMDASITKVLQAVQEEFPPSRTHPRRKSSSAHSNASPSPSMSSSFIGSIPIADDNSLPTSSELYSYTGQSPDPNTHSSSFALSTSPSEVDEQGLPHLHTSGTSAYPSASFSVTGSGSGSGSTDGQETPRAERTAPLSAEAVTNNTYLHTSLDDDSRAIPERQEISSSSAMPTSESLCALQIMSQSEPAEDYLRWPSFFLSVLETCRS